MDDGPVLPANLAREKRADLRRRLPELLREAASFKRKTRAPFRSTYARDYRFITEESVSVRVPSRDREKVIARIDEEMTDFAYYL
jgi:hypothetical protein